jgi:hypothetical protein
VAAVDVDTRTRTALTSVCTNCRLALELDRSTIVRMTRSKKLDKLVSSVEDLLARLPNNLTPELAALRDKVDSGIFEAWSSLAGEERDALNRASRHSADRFWITVGLTLLAGTASLFAYRIGRPTPR